MASAGPNSPSTAENIDKSGGTAWGNLTNLYTANDSGANIGYTEIPTDWLVGKGFGFSIPSGATIDGIVVEWRLKRNGIPTFDNGIRIVKGGVIGTTDRSSGSDWPADWEYRTYGSSSDLWGETWTSSDINSADFGAALSAIDSVGFIAPGVDHVRITVYYTEGGGGVSIPVFVHHYRQLGSM